jgi:chromodomain-helicase-DNA-binding protein 1
MQQAAGMAAPTAADVRFSNRRAGKITTYAEEENDDDLLVDEDEDMMTPSYYAAEETGPAVDKVLDHRRKPEGDGQHLRESDYQYFIKWQDRSHYHATWEEYGDLTSLRGAKKVKNYYMNIIRHEIDMAEDPSVSLEDKEQYILDRERQADALAEYTQVERVIARRMGDDGTEYMVKWRGLLYDSCTWETAPVVSSLSQHEIDRYLDRANRITSLDKTEANFKTRSRYKAFHTQPEYIKGGQLREFQIKGVNFLAMNWCKGNNVILADEMGLGKTVQTVSFISWLHHDRGQEGPHIVVVPLSTMPAWADTLDKWAPDLNYVIYTGNETARTIIRDQELFVDGNPRKCKFNVLLTTYDYMTMKGSWSPQLQQVKWQFLAVDEAHRLKNAESSLFARLMELGAPTRLLITGTPVQNNLGELAALMNFLMPGRITVEDDIDLQSEEASRQLAELTDQISPYIIRRTKAKVENDLPPKTEKIVRVELSDFQLEYYKNILTRNYAALNEGGTGQRTSLLNIMMELKKASNHPFMFPNAEERLLAGSSNRGDILKALITSSGKMMLLDQLLTKMKKEGHRVLIFSQMVKMLDILGDYLHARGHQFQRLDGTIASGPRKLAIDHFNAPDSKDFCFLLSTRAGGLGINLMTADTVIIFDSDWNPQADLQAMARAHRIGQKNPVSVYRLVAKDTVEEEVLERARNKLMLEFITIQRGVTDKDSKDIADRLKKSVNAPEDADDINRILKKRGQKMFEQTGNQKRLEELDIDAVLENAEEHRTEQPEGLTADGGEEFLKNFEYTDVKVELEWDQIIPKSDLETIKAEEKRLEEERYLASVIEANAPRKRGKPVDDKGDGRSIKKRGGRDFTAEVVVSKENTPEPDPEADPARPLEEKEIRNLIRAYERYGSFDERADEIIRDAKLLSRDPGVVKATVEDVLNTCRTMIQAEQDKIKALEAEGSPPAKKDKKAILFDYKGVKRLNAETLLERPVEMRMIRDVVASAPDYKNFRVPEATKGAQYTSPWGAREDGMLCVGIARHGYGAWVPIRDDPDLGMADKFYLEEHQVAQKEERTKAVLQGVEAKAVRSPGAVHLVRRANYLLTVLKEKTSHGANEAAKRAIENHHRNNKRRLLGRPSSSPGPGSRKGDSSTPRARPNRDSPAYQNTFERQASTQRDDKHKVPRNKDTDRLRVDKYATLDRHIMSNGGGRSPSMAIPKPATPRHTGDKSAASSSQKLSKDSALSSQRESKNSIAKPAPSKEAGPSTNGTATREEHMEKVFRSQKKDIESLKDVKKATDSKVKLEIMKKVLRAIALHIVGAVQEDRSLTEDQCWYVFLAIPGHLLLTQTQGTTLLNISGSRNRLRAPL